MEAGGRLGPAAKKFIDEVMAECEMSEAARKAAASKIMRAIGIEVLHKMAALVQELRNEEQFMADGVLQYYSYRCMQLHSIAILQHAALHTQYMYLSVPRYHGTSTSRCK